MKIIESNITDNQFLDISFKILETSLLSFVKYKEKEMTIKEIQENLNNKADCFSEKFKEDLKEVKYSIQDNKKLKMIGIIDGDYKGIVQHSLKVKNNELTHFINFSFFNVKTREYFVLLKKISLENNEDLLLSNNRLVDLYKLNKKEIYNTSLLNSLINYGEIKRTSKDSFFSDDIAKKQELIILSKLFSFCEKNISNLEKDNKNYLITINNLFYEDILMPFLKVFNYDNYFNDIDNSFITNDLLNKMIKTNSQLEILKLFLPKANKKTFSLLTKILEGENDLGTHEVENYESVELINTNVLNSFKNTERLNDFLDNIHSVYMSSYHNEIEIIYNNDEKEFFTNILPKMFSSQIKYENNLIKKLKLFMKDIDKDLDNQENDYEEGLNNIDCDCECTCDCDCDFDEDEGEYCTCECYCDCDCIQRYEFNNTIIGENNINLLNEIMIDTFKSYNLLMSSYEKQNKEMKSLIDNVLSKKYKDIEDIHNILADLVTRLTTKKKKFIKPDFLKNESFVKKNNLEIILVDNNYLLKQVGLEMHHCVASYENDILKKKTSIVALKENNRFVSCLEINNEYKSVKQAKGKFNIKINDDKHLSIIKDFIKMNELNVSTTDL